MKLKLSPSVWIIGLTVLVILLLSACSATPYAEVGAGYNFNSSSVLNPDYGGGRDPTAHFEVGMEWDNQVSCGLHHWSHWRDGYPFNNNPETYKNEVVCKKRWGSK